MFFFSKVNGIGEDIGATILTGKVIRPLRSVDPSQAEYQGLIEVVDEGRCHQSSCSCSDFLLLTLFAPILRSAGGKGQSYPFGIMGMSNKGDCLQKGEFVKFQVCTISQTGQMMACNVVPQRRAVVECVKDQVCLISV